MLAPIPLGNKTSGAREKAKMNWKNDLQIRGKGEKSRKRPTRSWARNQMGNIKLTVNGQRNLNNYEQCRRKSLQIL
jgi:hypothetical protein